LFLLLRKVFHSLSFEWARTMPSNGIAPKPFGALEVAFLGRRQQRVQHLDRRLEHLDELEQALVGQAQAAREAVRVRVVLGEGLELSDVDLADQRRDVLVVLVARLGLGDADLLEHARVALDDLELPDVAAVLVEALDRPRGEDPVQVARRDAVLLLEQRAVLERVEQAERRLVHRRSLDRVERHVLHELLQALGDRALAAADRAEQVEDLLLLLQALGGVAEVAHDLLDRVLHAVELGEGGVDLDHLVGEQARHPGVVARVDHQGLADRLEHALGGGGVGQRIALALREVVFDRQLFFATALEARCKVADDIHADLLCGEEAPKACGLRRPGKF
jgi:hypothetical protein